MSELPSALFSIADGSEFRFARFYNVCEAAALVATRKVAHCLRTCRTHAGGVFKRGRDTESDADIQLEEMLAFFSNEFPAVFLSEIPQCVFLIILLIPQKRSMLIAAAPSGSFLTVRRSTISLRCSATPPLLFRTLRSASVQGTATGRPLFSAFPRSVL